MTDNAMFTDLLAAQKEMPALQKSAINPHFGNRFVPLDELIPAVLPILNKHNLVLLQQPTTADGKPALRTVLLHTSGEVMESTMLLMESKPDPQQQGSGITYARRYSLLSWLGLVADVDDDANTAMTQRLPAPPTPRAAPQRPVAPANTGPVPNCPEHGPMRLRPGGTSKSGKVYGEFYSCGTRNCETKTVWANEWRDQLAQQAQLASNPSGAPADPDELPFE